MEDRHTRSSFLKLGGAAALGAAGLPAVAHASPSRLASAFLASETTLQLANDKVTWKPWFNTVGQDAAKAVGVGWKATEFADTTTYQAQIRTSGRTPKVPDLYSWWSGWLMKDIVDAGFAADISSLWKKHASAYGPGTKAAFTFGGKTYGAPLYLGYWVVLYNKHVFKDAKVAPPKTWAQLEKLNSTIKGNGVTPFGATIDGRWPGFIYFEEFLIRSNPGLYTRLMAGKAKYTDPGVVNAMKQWGTWIEKGYFNDPSAVTLGTGSSNFPSQFKQGKIAMVQIGTWFEPSLVAAGLKPGTDFDAFILPMMKPSAKKVVVFETGPLVVGEHGSKKDDAIKALDYFMSRKGQDAWVKTTGFVSPRSDVKSTSPVDRALSAEIIRGRYPLLNRYWEATPHDIVEVAVDQFDKFMLKGGDPKPILQTIQKQADKSWSTIKK
jgi:ABC-type glycerol-3-phosphate transport system substrate-binding protein